VIEIVSFTGTFTDSGKNGVTSVSLGNIVDQLHDKYGLANTGTTKETNLSTLDIGGQQVYDFDTSDENLLFDRHLSELGSLGMNGGSLGRVDGSPLINGVTNNVDDSAKSFLADRDSDGGAGVEDLVSSYKTLCSVHGNGSHCVLSQMLGYLQNETGFASCYVQGIENLRESILKLYVDDGTNDGNDLALVALLGRGGGGVLTIGDRLKSWQGL